MSRRLTFLVPTEPDIPPRNLDFIVAKHVWKIASGDPEETPLQLRAKISLEIYTLAELQRLSMESNDAMNFMWAEPTAWDCPILPGLPYKPDNIWCFTPQGHVFETAGSCTINASEVGYVLILEVLEQA